MFCGLEEPVFRVDRHKFDIISVFSGDRYVPAVEPVTILAPHGPLVMTQ